MLAEVVRSHEAVLADRFADGLMDGGTVGSTVGLLITTSVGSYRLHGISGSDDGASIVRASRVPVTATLRMTSIKR